MIMVLFFIMCTLFDSISDYCIFVHIFMVLIIFFSSRFAVVVVEVLRNALGGAHPLVLHLMSASASLLPKHLQRSTCQVAIYDIYAALTR